MNNQFNFLENNKDISAICSWVIAINSIGVKTHYYNQKIKNYGDFFGYLLIGKSPLYHPAVMYRKDDILSINGYDTNFSIAEDFDLWRRMAEKRLNVSIINEYGLLHRKHNKNESIINQNKFMDVNLKIQFETVEKFSNCKDDINNCLTALLRLSPDPCGREYDKIHLKKLVIHLNENVIKNICKKMNMSTAEIKTFKKRIFKRLGYGVRYIRLFSILPNLIYYPIFLVLSPLIKPNIYRFISKSYRKIQQIVLRLSKS